MTNIRGLSTETATTSATQGVSVRLPTGTSTPSIIAVADGGNDGTARELQYDEQGRIISELDQQILDINFTGASTYPVYSDESGTAFGTAVSNGMLTMNTASDFSFGQYRYFGLDLPLRTGTGSDLRVRFRAKYTLIDNPVAPSNPPAEEPFAGIGLVANYNFGTAADAVKFVLRQNEVTVVIRRSSSDVLSYPLPLTITTSVMHDYELLITPNKLQVYIDSALQLTIDKSDVDAPRSLPNVTDIYSWRPAAYVEGAGKLQVSRIRAWTTAAPTATSAQIAASSAETNFWRPIGEGGSALGYWPYNATPATPATWSNTAVGQAGWGGMWRSPTTWPASGETDYVVLSQSITAPNGSSGPKNFIVTRVEVSETAVYAALTGGPLLLQWTVSVGSAASLATSDSTTAVSHRFIPIGTQAIAATAAIGARSGRLSIDFASAPILVPVGSSLNFNVKVLGTNVTVGQVRGGVGVFGYWSY